MLLLVLRIACALWFFLYLYFNLFLFSLEVKLAKKDGLEKMNDPKRSKVSKILASFIYGYAIYPFKSLLVMSAISFILFYIFLWGFEMNFSIKNLNRFSTVLNLTIGKIFPIAGIATSQFAVVTQSGVTGVAISNGSSQADFISSGIKIDGSTIALTAKIEGAIVAMAAVAGFSVGWLGLGISVGLSAIAGAIAASANQSVRDVLTDPEFWASMKDEMDGLEEYFKNRTGRSLGEFLEALLDGFLSGNITKDLSTNVNDTYNQSRNFVQRSDPLVLDLDGDGIETIGIGSKPVLFDFDGDGSRTGTGWLKGDDAFVVLNRNGNGVIDNGSELFGVDTVLKNGQKASSGFTALADLDSNSDGVFDNHDALYAQTKLWQDLNQDGISQANELKTLAQAGIASINLAHQASNTLLAGGNLLSGQGDYTKTNGEVGTVGEFISGSAGNFDLASNPFYREFDKIALCEAAKKLPGMQGSGAVRDLQEAASLAKF